jgi:hypothetical protein
VTESRLSNRFIQRPAAAGQQDVPAFNDPFTQPLNELLTQVFMCLYIPQGSANKYFHFVLPGLALYTELSLPKEFYREKEKDPPSACFASFP